MYKLANNQISSHLSGQTTILDYQSGVYYGLNSVGTHIWKMLEKSPADFNTLKTSILDVFEIDEKTCKRDLDEVLSKLINAKLVEKI